MFLEISQNSQENTSARASFLIKLFFNKTGLSSRREKTGPVTSGHVKSSQLSNETPYIYKGFSFTSEQVEYFYF